MPILKKLNSKTVIVAPSDSELVSTAHIIEDGVPNSYAQRARLQFLEGSGINISITDDEAGNRTVVNIVNTNAGGVGSGGVDEGGNALFILEPTITTEWILQSPDLTKWAITVDNTGALVATSGATGDVSDFVINRFDTTDVSFAITDAGEIQVVNPADPGTFKQYLFLAAPDTTAWQITVNNSDQIVTNSTTAKTNYFKVQDGNGDTLFQIQEEEVGKGQAYFLIYDNATLPASPTSVSGLAAFAMYDTGSAIRPIYFDNTAAAWKYVADNSLV